MHGALLLGVLLALGPPPAWKVLAPGLEYATTGDEPLHLVRVDPRRASLEAVMASAGDGRPRTAADWCRTRHLAVAMNLGMYRDDKRTNVGHAHLPGHVNNASWNAKYNSALAFGPTRPGLAPATLVDLDLPGARAALAGYGTVIQNLRLIRAPGRGVWTAQDRKWSEAAVAIDRSGRVIFAFSRHPHSMRAFTHRLLALPLGITAAMHVEGGPEASLSVHAGGVDLDLEGSYETGFNENDDERTQWPIPNVVGVRRVDQ
jgi:hypothetical protein